MMGAMDGTRVNRTMRALGAVLGVIVALLMCGPTAGVAQAAVAAPAGDAIAIGDPHALGVVDLYVDPMCPFSGKMVQEQGDEIGQRIEDGRLRVNLRFVDFLDKYSASKTYDIRATYAAFVVADQSRSSGVWWRFVQQIFSAEQQPEEEGTTDLDNNQLAELANRVGAPSPAQISSGSACRSVTTPTPSQPTTSRSCASFPTRCPDRRHRWRTRRRQFGLARRTTGLRAARQPLTGTFGASWASLGAVT